MESRVVERTSPKFGAVASRTLLAIKGFVEAAPVDAAIAHQLSKHAMAYFIWRRVGQYRETETVSCRNRFLVLVRQH